MVWSIYPRRASTSHRAPLEPSLLHLECRSSRLNLSSLAMIFFRGQQQLLQVLWWLEVHLKVRALLFSNYSDYNITNCYCPLNWNTGTEMYNRSLTPAATVPSQNPRKYSSASSDCSSCASKTSYGNRKAAPPLMFRNKRPAPALSSTSSMIKPADVIALVEACCPYCNKEECDGGGCVGSGRCVLCGNQGHSSKECKEDWRSVLTGRACFSCGVFSTNGKCGRESFMDKQRCNKRKKRLLRILMFGGLGKPARQHYQNQQTFEAFLLSSYTAMRATQNNCSGQAAKRNRLYQ